MIYHFTNGWKYDSLTGELFSKKNPTADKHKKKADGYTQVFVFGKLQYKHVFIWEQIHGKVPEGFVVDHRDRNPSHDWLSNLRLITIAENSQNRRPKPSSHLPGVQSRPNGSFRARISVDKVRIHIGDYPTAEEAHEAYKHFKKNYHVEGAVDALAR
jgi:hypothetical protein